MSMYPRDLNVFTSFYRYTSITKKYLSNRPIIKLGSSEIDGMDEVCSILTKCNCVSYQKFVVKSPTWQPCDSLLQKLLANQMS